MASKPIPIGTKRFTVAPPGHERSKAALLKDNGVLYAKLVSMSQLLAAILLGLPDDEPEFTFEIAELETLSPKMLRLEMTDTHVTIGLSDEADAMLRDDGPPQSA